MLSVTMKMKGTYNHGVQHLTVINRSLVQIQVLPTVSLFVYVFTHGGITYGQSYVSSFYYIYALQQSWEIQVSSS